MPYSDSMSVEKLQPFLGTTYVSEEGWTRRPRGAYVHTIRFDPESGTCTIQSTLGSMTPDAANWCGRILSKAADYAEIQAFLAQRERNHPSKHGLVLRPLPRNQSSLGFAPELWNAEENTADPALNVPAEDSRHGGGGWFAPDADPNQLGALFAHPNVSSRDGHRLVTWQIGQVGLSEPQLATPLGSADWDDSAGCADVFQLVQENQYESYLVAAALSTDPETLAAARRRQQKRADTLRARELFRAPSTRIKPRVASELASLAYQGMSTEWRQTFSDANLSFRITQLSLDDWSLGVNGKAVHAGLQLSFAPGYWSRPRPEVTFPEDHFDAFAGRLQARMDERQQGRIYRMTVPSARHPFLLVTKRIEHVLATGVAFGINANTVVEEYTGTPGSPWRPVDWPAAEAA